MPITKEKRTEIIEALKANSNASAVVKQIGGVSLSTIWNIAKQAGIELTAGRAARGNPHPRLSLSEEKRSQIIEALKANSNASAVVKQIGGVSHQTVWRIAKQAEIKLTAGQAAKGNFQPKLSEEKRTQIIAAFKAHPNARAVSKQVGGVSHQGVLDLVRKTNLEVITAKQKAPAP